MPQQTSLAQQKKKFITLRKRRWNLPLRSRLLSVPSVLPQAFHTRELASYNVRTYIIKTPHYSHELDRPANFRSISQKEDSILNQHPPFPKPKTNQQYIMPFISSIGTLQIGQTSNVCHGRPSVSHAIDVERGIRCTEKLRDINPTTRVNHKSTYQGA